MSPNYNKKTLSDLKKSSLLKKYGIPKIKYNLSPLRYPGGKSKLAYYLAYFIKLNKLENHTLVEPFCGGAGGTLPLLCSGLIKKLVLNDSNPFIYAFWHSVFFDTEALIKEIEKIDVTLENWQKQKSIYTSENNNCLIDKALAVFYLNRTNRSGMLHAGPIGGQSQTGNYKIDCRFNKKNLIERIKYLSLFSEQVETTNLDASELLNKKHDDKTFIYADPPYVKEGKNIYNKYCFTEQDHINFSDRLKLLDQPWLLSYDDDELVHHLYSTSGINIIELSYVINRARIGRELLIGANKIKMPNLEDITIEKNIEEVSNFHVSRLAN